MYKLSRETLDLAPSHEVPNVELQAQSEEDGFGCIVTVLDDATGEKGTMCIE